jgi:predicted cupin superfamily sugar epimerase/quercetin dioxygenase-like cupin family protein
MVGAFGCANLAGFASATGIAEPPRPSGMAGKLIAHYHMRPIPVEGAWFSVTYLTDDSIDGAALPARYAGRQHAAGSAIVVVETRKDFSALHRLNTDEVWHFYSGSPLKMLLLYPDGHGRSVTLGANVLAGESPQVTVPHGVWQGSVPGASSATSYSFVGTQMSPAFDAADFEIGERDELQRRYPAFSKEIALLTRAEFAGGPAALAAAVEQPGLRAAAFSAANMPQSTMAAGVSLQELVGRVARDAKTPALSIAKFTLAPGASSGTSLNRRALEVFLVTQGSGQVHLGNEVTSVRADSTVFIPPEVPHSIEAGADSLMEFYAVSAPAFAPEDYVLVKP